jgi:peptide deformylase
MKDYDLLIAGDPELRRKAQDVKCVDEEVRQLFQDMVHVMHRDDGFGLAATQIGVHKRVIVLDCNESYLPGEGYMYIVNPKILWKSEETDVQEEACMSVPGLGVPVERSLEIKMFYLDENNEECRVHAKDFFARVLQHELDHLEGKLMIDYLSPLKRKMALKKMQRITQWKNPDEVNTSIK